MFFSNVFERLMRKQTNVRIKNIISLFMGIQKGFQYAVCFIVSYRTLEKKILDEKGFVGALLMDLSKAFNIQIKDTLKIL